jgi:hypothetical protein
VIDDEQPPVPPVVLERRHTDEYVPPPLSEPAARARDEVLHSGEGAAKRVGQTVGRYWAGRLGTAAALLAINRTHGERFFELPEQAALDEEAAIEGFAGIGPVIDVQTHFIADQRQMTRATANLMASYRNWAPEWWTGLDGMVGYGFAEFLRCIFVESETIAAVLTAPPADANGDRFLDNLELAGTREILDRMAGTGRLFNHVVVHPSVPGELDRMAGWSSDLHPIGWKVYTAGGVMLERDSEAKSSAFMLDDEQSGIPFLELARTLGTRVICSHKGISSLAANGSPRDIGPSARAFPELEFVVYHSGYEPALEEGAYTEESAHLGANRLITSLREAGIGPGGNVCAELGTTWFCLMKRPVEAAHLLGKLLLAMGEDNVIWGTDSIWYGPTQPLVDAFRVFQIPVWMRERYGYPELTPEIRDKILCRNAARVYGFDVGALTEAARTDPVSWTRAAEQEARRHGLAARR